MKKAALIVVLCFFAFYAYAIPTTETITSRLERFSVGDSGYSLFWFDENLIENLEDETEIMKVYTSSCHATEYDGVWLEVTVTDFFSNKTAKNRGWDVKYHANIFDEFSTINDEKHTRHGEECELVSYNDYTKQGQERVRVVLRQHIVEGIYWYYCSNVIERDGDFIYFSIIYLSGEEDTAKVIENCMLNQTLI